MPLPSQAAAVERSNSLIIANFAAAQQLRIQAGGYPIHGWDRRLFEKICGGRASEEKKTIGC